MDRAASSEWVRINLVSVGRVGTAAVCLPSKKLLEKKTSRDWIRTLYLGPGVSITPRVLGWAPHVGAWWKRYRELWKRALGDIFGSEETDDPMGIGTAAWRRGCMGHNSQMHEPSPLELKPSPPSLQLFLFALLPELFLHTSCLH